jgi:branched-chain amino acid aminotransferase
MSAEIRVEKVNQSRIDQVNFDNLIFGNEFSDHMLICLYQNGKWGEALIKPYGPISYLPAMSVLHYGQAVFEGMKAFRQENGEVVIFRAQSHYDRFVRSCKRVVIPEIPKNLFIDGLKKLIDTDKNWVPKEKYKSLYIRPFVFATDEYLGVRASKTYAFVIITSPVGNYYKEGINPVKLTTMPDYVRAVKGGVGDAKVPGNYAASLLPAQKALEQGFTQVLWLDANAQSNIEEVGTSNMFFVVNGNLITPFLSGSILQGITRDSVIKLARHKGLSVDERTISIQDVFDWHKSGSLTEVFATGTAAVISPVGSIHHNGNTITLNEKEMGPISKMLYTHLTDIHRGDQPDPFGWCEKI